MLYNDIASYNHNNITYSGIIQLNVPGLSSPIIIGNLSVVISVEPDYSNATTIGIITYDFAPSGEIILETTQDQAEAITQAEILIINSISGEAYTQNVNQSQVLSQTSIFNSISVSGEISIETV